MEIKRFVLKFEKLALFKTIQGFTARMREDCVTAYSAKASYFLIMSFIPFTLFLTTLVRYTSVSYDMLNKVLTGIVPNNLHSYVNHVVADVYTRSEAYVPLSAITALWSAGKGLQAITNGLNSIYRVKETRNWLMTRIISVIYTLFFIIALLISLTLTVLGGRIQSLIQKQFPAITSIVISIINQILHTRNIIVPVFLFFIFLILYKVLPNRRATFKSQIPGAALTAISWYIFSYLFSLYFVKFPDFTDMYGNMAALILVMIWMYMCMTIALLGAEINAYFEKQLREAKNKVKNVINKKINRV